VLEAVSIATGETVNLAMLRGQTVVQVAQIDSRFLLGTTDWVNVEVPPHCSALGKVFYAEGVVPIPSGRMERRTPKTMTSPGAFRSQLERVRAAGYAEALGELELGSTPWPLQCATHPTSRRCARHLGPERRLAPQLPQLRSLLKAHAEDLSHILGRQTRKDGAA
jgi:DNA-binding IclR family transcriptional regulator